MSYNNQNIGGSFMQNNESQHKSGVDQQQYEVLVRKADLDDYDDLQALIRDEGDQSIALLYSYPKLLTLFETSYLSVSILDKEQNIIGCAVFNDYPQGVEGEVDYRHENFWEKWLNDGWQAEETIGALSSYNSLWMTFFMLGKKKYGISEENQLQITQRVFQNVYGTMDGVNGILFMKRYEAIQAGVNQEELENVLSEMFFRIDPREDVKGLKQLRGVQLQSEFYYSPASTCTPLLHIRMAREEDHDDLAEIFNRQSDVHTKDFGEFFIADMIATQNQTRRAARSMKSDGKAIVGQVGEKAIGMMSISSEIDYLLLGQCFELEPFDNLYKAGYQEAIRQRIEWGQTYKTVQQELVQYKKLNQLRQEAMKCHIIGQRIYLQSFCIEREQDIKLSIDNYLTNDEQAKTLTKEIVTSLIQGWLQGYQIFAPSQLFLEFPEECKSLECIIQSPLQILVEALEFFGLPQGYMDGQGHWKDWAKKILEEKKAASLRKPKKQNKVTRKKAKKDDDKKDDELKPPTWFDLQPFLQAFQKFVSVSAEQRTYTLRQIENNIKKVIMLFCNQDGELIPTRHVDLIAMGEILRARGLDIPNNISDNFANTLECFGELECDERIIQVIKEEKDTKVKGKEAPLKKIVDQNEQPKAVDVLQKMTSFKEFRDSTEKIRLYDRMMCRLGLVKSNSLTQEIEEQIENEEKMINNIQNKAIWQSNQNEYEQYLQDIQSISKLPEVPTKAQNAIVINLFCVDEQYESRSLEFVEYAFSLFPDRDYIILTQPYTVQETSLLQKFIQVPRKQNSTFEHVLYIFHRDSLAGSAIKIRKSKIQDINDCSGLMQSLLNPKQVYSDMKEAIELQSISHLVCFSVFIEDSIIGMYCLSKNVNLQYLTAHFCIQDHIILKEHPPHLHTKLIHSILNPLFVKQTRFILKEILRFLGKTTLYFEIHDRTLLPDIFNEFVFVRARSFPHLLKRPWDFTLEPEQLERLGQYTGIDQKRNPYDQEDTPFSLSILTKKQLSSTRVQNNTRIVVVGASDTGLSFIESLLTIKDIYFTNIILLAPGGIHTMHVNHEFDQLRAQSTNYTLEELRGLMIDARVTVIDAKMVKLDKKNNRILIDKNAFIPFDLLIVTVGLIDTELQNKGRISFGLSESPYYKDKKYVDGVYSIDDPYLYKHFKNNQGKKSNIHLLTRKKKPQNLAILGNTLHTISLISGLINKGVDPHRIHLIMPPKTFKKQTNFKTNKERLEYEDKMINDPDQFDNNVVQSKVFDLLDKLGVHVHKGYNLSDLVTGQEGIGANSKEILQRTIFSKKADDFEEITSLIEQKKQEILERMQNSENNGDKNLDLIDYNEDGEEGAENAENTLEKEVERLEARLFDYLEIDCRFFITSGLIDIDKEIFSIIHENGLVYNGRLIVKSNFQTTQNNIFACGKICEFSQRYKYHSVGKSLRLDKYNGRELGQKLSKCILEQLDLSYLTSQTYSVDELPQLYMPIGQGSIIPKNIYYYHIKKNDNAKPKALLNKESEKKTIISDNFHDGKGHFLQFIFDHNGLVDTVTYLGSEAIKSPSLIQFIDLSSKYMNKLEQRFESKLISNVTEFLSENWAIALYHEWFSEFRHITKSEMLKNELIDQVLEKAQHYARDGNYFDENFYEEIKKLISEEIVEQIQDGTIEFLRENQNHLPMYFIPEKKTQQKEEI